MNEFESVFRKSCDVLLIIDAEDGLIVDVSNAAKWILGYDKKNLIGKHFSVLFPPEENQSREELLEELQSYGGAFIGEKLLAADGKIRAMDLTATILAWKNKEIIFVTLRDITERKRAEDERIKKEKLQGVLEMAGATCHELNQPMQVILGYSQLLLMNLSENNRYYNWIDKIQKQIEEMAIITKKLSMITNYEVRNYYGDKKIIDIDKASSKKKITQDLPNLKSTSKN